jgi:hypothetical protein
MDLTPAPLDLCDDSSVILSILRNCKLLDHYKLFAIWNGGKI